MPYTVHIPDAGVAADFTLRAYSDGLLPELVQFWNAEFCRRPNFAAMTPQRFRERVAEQWYQEEPFDPRGLILAWEPASGRVVGMVHCGVRSEQFCRAVYSDWPGGGEAYIAMLAAARTRRGRGIGTALWNAAREYAELNAPGWPLVIDSKCLNPYYGNSDGLYPPPWGTTEGIGIPWGDAATRRFLERRGYRPSARAVSMELMLDAAGGQCPELKRGGLSIRWIGERCPPLGGSAGETLVSGTGPLCGALCCLDGERVAGFVATYSMANAVEGKAAIYDFELLPDYRGLGIGTALLHGLIGRLRDHGATRCEVLTIPTLSTRAFLLYRRAGFDTIAEWAVY